MLIEELPSVVQNIIGTPIGKMVFEQSFKASLDSWDGLSEWLASKNMPSFWWGVSSPRVAHTQSQSACHDISIDAELVNVHVSAHATLSAYHSTALDIDILDLIEELGLEERDHAVGSDELLGYLVDYCGVYIEPANMDIDDIDVVENEEYPTDENITENLCEEIIGLAMPVQDCDSFRDILHQVQQRVNSIFEWIAEQVEANEE